MNTRLIVIVIAASLCGCASNNAGRRVWTSPDHSLDLRFVPGPDGTAYAAADTYSYYSLHQRKTGQRLAAVRSIIPEHQLDLVRRQEVHFSPTARIIVIEEDVSDASPHFCYTLLERDSAGFWSRDIKMPMRDTPFPFGSWPHIVAVTESEVSYRYPESSQIETRKISELPSMNHLTAEQTGTGQPATRPVDEPEGGIQPQPEAEGRSR